MTKQLPTKSFLRIVISLIFCLCGINEVQAQQAVKIVTHHEAARTSSVSSDSTVTGPTSVLSDPYFPSCLYPSFSSDSILVTIPAHITITHLYVTASYYADPTFGAIILNGQIYFNTSCGISDTLSVDSSDAGSLRSGVGYLYNFDMDSALAGCFSPSCSIQTFWLTMHLSRKTYSTGCNYDYIYYDPGAGGFYYPFEAHVVGQTVDSVNSAPCTTTGLESYSTSNSKIYPNPTHDELNITETDGMYEIYNLLGQELLNGTWIQNKTFSVKNLSSGVYFLKIQNEKGSWVSRFEKE